MSNERSEDGSSSWICDICQRNCKSKKGYSLHRSKCESQSHSKTCIYCETSFSTIYSLKRHLDTCRVYLEQKEKEQQERQEKEQQEKERQEEERNQRLKELEEYKQKAEKDKQEVEKQLIRLSSKLEKEEERHNNMINMIKEEQRLMYREKEDLKDKLKASELTILKQTEKISDLEKKNDHINSKMIQFAEKATDKVTTIYNGSTIQNNTLQLQHFDGSLFRDKIIPPSRMVYSISGMVDFLHKLGIGNCYRSVDRSRKAVMWIDQDGKEIRDSNCSQLREKLLTTMEGDIRRQLEYQQKQLHDLEAIHGDSYTDSMVSLSDNIGFCKQLISRKASLMKELQKELSSRAKNKNDTTIDVPRVVGYTKFLTKLEECMFPTIYQWFELSFEDLGRWIATQLDDFIETEGAVLYKDKKFIKIRNDDGGFDVFYTYEFVTMIRKVYADIVSLKAQGAYQSYLTHHYPSSLTTKHNERIIWLREDKEKDPLADQLIRGILLHQQKR